VTVSADAPALSVVGHDDDRRPLEGPALGEPGQEVADVPVGAAEHLDVLAVARPSHVTDLVRRQQLKDEKVRVLALDHVAGGGGKRGVEALSRLHRGDRAHDLLAERVQEVRDPDQPAPTALLAEDVEDRGDPHPEPRSEVRAHAVLGGRRAGEHAREAHDRARGIRGLHVEVLRALPGQPVERRREALRGGLA